MPAAIIFDCSHKMQKQSDV